MFKNMKWETTFNAFVVGALSAKLFELNLGYWFAFIIIWAILSSLFSALDKNNV
jgi:hypothetical protein